QVLHRIQDARMVHDLVDPAQVQVHLARPVVRDAAIAALHRLEPPAIAGGLLGRERGERADVAALRVVRDLSIRQASPWHRSAPPRQPTCGVPPRSARPPTAPAPPSAGPPASRGRTCSRAMPSLPPARRAAW